VIKSAEHLRLATPLNLQIVEINSTRIKRSYYPRPALRNKISRLELFWVTDEELQNVKLAWNVNIDVAGSADWWNVRVDALTGNVIDKDNWTV